MYFGETRIQPLSYQARVQATLLASLMKEKALLAHPDKTGYLILGSKKYQEEVRQELVTNPIDFGKFTLKEKNKDKYLGQVVMANLSTSALATVQERAGKNQRGSHRN